MKTGLFDFTLPESLIADHPAAPRDTARMLVIEDDLLDKIVRDLPAFLRPGDVMVFNDTRVIPARLFGRRGDARVEILLHKPHDDNWTAFAKPAKRLKPKDTIVFADDFHAMVLAKMESGEVLLRFDCDGDAFRRRVERHGHMPLPPYIEKRRHADARDREHYQTIYARHEGSVAAPTAGLHFTDTLMKAIDERGILRAHITLHVGGGTFLPVKVDDTSQHVMHSEHATVTPETARLINEAKRNGGRVVAVGTTSLRTLESAADEQGVLHPYDHETNIFITPGYRFRLVDVLLTNFHLPRSTLFMLVSAFCGLETMKAAYKHAISERYRFYSYGDACLCFQKNPATRTDF